MLQVEFELVNDDDLKGFELEEISLEDELDIGEFMAMDLDASEALADEMVKREVERVHQPESSKPTQCRLCLDNQLRQSESKASSLLLSTYWLEVLESSYNSDIHKQQEWRVHVRMMVDLIVLTKPTNKAANPQIKTTFLPNLLRKIANELRHQDKYEIEKLCSAIKYEAAPNIDPSIDAIRNLTLKSRPTISIMQ